MRQRMARLGMAPLGVAWHGVAGFGPGWAGQYVPILPRSSLSMTAARLHHSGEWPMEAGALGLGHGPEVVVCPSEGARVLLPRFAPGSLCKAGPGNDLLPEGAFQQQRVGRFRESQTRKGRNRPGRSPGTG